jgi:hypothetical protein
MKNLRKLIRQIINEEFEMEAKTISKPIESDNEVEKMYKLIKSARDWRSKLPKDILIKYIKEKITKKQKGD